MTLSLNDFLSIGAVVAALQLIGSLWLKARLESSIKHEYDKKLEEFKFETRRREQSALVAAVLSEWISPDIDPAIASRMQSNALVGRVVELGSLGHMRRALPFLTLLPLALLASGCVTALHVASQPTNVRLRVQASHPEQHTVRVALEQTADYQVAPDGRVEFTVPRFSHGCDGYVLGVIKTRDGSAESVRVVEVRRAERVLRRLSLTQIAKLPTDEAGYSVVRIGD